jgi:hypothetical protein
VALFQVELPAHHRTAIEQLEKQTAAHEAERWAAQRERVEAVRRDDELAAARLKKGRQA